MWPWPALHAGAARALLQAPAAPSQVPREPRHSGTAGRHRGSPGISRPCAPCRAGRQKLLAASQGRGGWGCRSRVQAVSGKGPKPAPTLPCCRSLQLTDDDTRVASYLRQALLYLQSPQESMREAGICFMGEPGLPPRVRAARPQPYQLPWQRHLGPAPQSPGCHQGCCHPLKAVPLGLRIWQGLGLSPAGPGGLSMFLFRTVITSVVEEGKRALKIHVRQSQLPLVFHRHDTNRCVAEVRTCGVMLLPWQRARLPPALVPGRLQPPPGHGKGMRILCPGLWRHL